MYFDSVYELKYPSISSCQELLSRQDRVHNVALNRLGASLTSQLNSNIRVCSMLHDISDNIVLDWRYRSFEMGRINTCDQLLPE
jgi:hypothetical protein